MPQEILMRKLYFVLFLFIANSGYTQFYKSIIPSPEFTGALQKIVLDFRLDFHSIQDSLIAQQAGSETYSSKVNLPGFSDCSILRFHSVEDSSSAFEAIYYDGDNYDDAVKNYRNCIRMLKRSHMKWIDNTGMSFGGPETEPEPNVSFAVSTLRLNIQDQRYKDFCAQVELVSDLFKWQVHLNFINKRSDTEGPTNNN